MRCAIRTVIVAAVAAAVTTITTPARADLTGSSMNMSVTHAGMAGPLSSLTGLSYTYGSNQSYVKPGWGTLHVSSPILGTGRNNALKLDFTNYGYQALTGIAATTGTVQINNLLDPPSLANVQVLVNGTDIGSGLMPAGNGFKISWSTQTVWNMNPTGPYVIIAWDSAGVPAPGPLALVAAAGIVARRRRRR